MTRCCWCLCCDGSPAAWPVSTARPAAAAAAGPQRPATCDLHAQPQPKGLLRTCCRPAHLAPLQAARGARLAFCAADLLGAAQACLRHQAKAAAAARKAEEAAVAAARKAAQAKKSEDADKVRVAGHGDPVCCSQPLQGAASSRVTLCSRSCRLSKPQSGRPSPQLPGVCAQLGMYLKSLPGHGHLPSRCPGRHVPPSQRWSKRRQQRPRRSRLPRSRPTRPAGRALRGQRAPPGPWQMVCARPVKSGRRRQLPGRLLSGHPARQADGQCS